MGFCVTFKLASIAFTACEWASACCIANCSSCVAIRSSSGSLAISMRSRAFLWAFLTSIQYSLYRTSWSILRTLILPRTTTSLFVVYKSSSKGRPYKNTEMSRLSAAHSFAYLSNMYVPSGCTATAFPCGAVHQFPSIFLPPCVPQPLVKGASNSQTHQTHQMAAWQYYGPRRTLSCNHLPNLQATSVPEVC